MTPLPAGQGNAEAAAPEMLPGAAARACSGSGSTSLLLEHPSAAPRALGITGKCWGCRKRAELEPSVSQG